MVELMSALNDSNDIICEACGVRISNNLAHYSRGNTSTLDKLSAKVCQYKKVDRPCANKEYDSQIEYPNPFDLILKNKFL